MSSPLKVFSVRSSFTVPYQVPAIDVLDEDSGVLVLPPAQPTIVNLLVGEIEWSVVSGATGYYVERLVSGTLWDTQFEVTDPEQDFYFHEDILGPAFYRVRAYNTAGASVPSNSMFLAGE
jgi:hypothetical protein